MRKKQQAAALFAAVFAAAAVGGCTGKQEILAPAAGVEETVAAAEDGNGPAGAREKPAADEAAAMDGILTVIEDEAVPLYAKPAGSHVRTPQAGGTVTYGNDRATIDASNASQGYVMVRYSGSRNRIKIQVSKGASVYTYDLNARDAYEVFPFSEGNGTYTVKVLENVRDSQYSQVFSQDINVSLSDQFLPFLYPNQYVNFTENSAAVRTGAQVAAPAADAIGVVTNVYNYVTENIAYDTAKATSVQSGYLPDVDSVLASRKGICFDYAALMTAMLRSQDIPTKLVIGYTGSLYHAWVNVYIDNVGWVDNIIYFDGQNWSLMDPTFGASAGKDESVKQYIGNGSNYQAKYSY